MTLQCSSLSLYMYLQYHITCFSVWLCPLCVLFQLFWKWWRWWSGSPRMTQRRWRWRKFSSPISRFSAITTRKIEGTALLFAVKVLKTEKKQFVHLFLLSLDKIIDVEAADLSMGKRQLWWSEVFSYYLSLVTRKCVFGDFRPSKI